MVKIKFLPLLATLIGLSATVQAEPLRIVCIGDSITQGRGGSNPTYSWRYPLWKYTVDANWDVDFVGSLNGGFNGDPNWADYMGESFDREHESTWGIKASAMASQLPIRIASYTPDVALILLGTNDSSDAFDSPEQFGERVAGHYQTMINTLRSKNPNVIVLVGGPFQEWSPFGGERTALQNLATTISTEASPVIYVAHEQGWVSNPDNAATDTVDWVHPNQQGDQKLASNWLPVLAQFMPYTYDTFRTVTWLEDNQEPEYAAMADADNDGYSNGFEFAVGSDATSVNTANNPTFTVENGEMVYSFAINPDTNLRYVVRSSTDGSDWSTIQYDSLSDETEDLQKTVRVSVPTTGTLLLRLEVEEIAG